MIDSPINPHVCPWCGTSAWTSPALDPSGRPCLALSLHLTPAGALCGRGGFALDEPAPTPERQRRWCVLAMRDVLMLANDVMVSVMALNGALFAQPPAVAVGIAGRQYEAVQRAHARLGIGPDKHMQHLAQRTTDTCHALATVTDITWDDIDQDGKLRARLELVARVAAMEAAEDEARAEADGPLFGRGDRRPS